MKRLMLWIVISLLCAGTAAPRNALALGRDERTIATSGFYGILAGTGMGLIALPSTQSSKSVLIGASIGLYLGIAVGVYHIYHREDPGNPLSPYSSQGAPQGTPQDAQASSTPLRVDFQVYTF